MTEVLAGRLEHCMSREDIGQSPDHIPIPTHVSSVESIPHKVKSPTLSLHFFEKRKAKGMLHADISAAALNGYRC